VKALIHAAINLLQQIICFLVKKQNINIYSNETSISEILHCKLTCKLKLVKYNQLHCSKYGIQAEQEKIKVLTSLKFLS